MAFRERLEGLLSGADPMGNLGLGLLAASGPSAMPQSLGQVLASGMQFASERQRAAMQNDALREQMAEQKRRADASQQLTGLLGGAEPVDQQQLLGLLSAANPDAFTQAASTGLLGQMFPDQQGLESPIGKLLNDRTLIARNGSPAALQAVDAAIERELGGADLGKVLQVRDDVTSNSKAFLEAQAGYQKVQAAATADTPAGDMSLIFGFMKVLDPGSIVKEGEFATVENSAGIPERIRGVYNRILRGERLTPEQRQDFSSQAHSQFVPLVEQQQRLVRDAQSFAERNRLPFSDIVPEFVMPLLPEPISPPTNRGVGATTGGLLHDVQRDLRGLFGPKTPPLPAGFTLDRP